MRRTAWYAFIVASTLAGLALLWQFSLAIVLFLLSLVVASALRSPISKLVARGNSRRRSLGLVYSAVVVSTAGLIVLLAHPVGVDLQQFADDVVIGYERIKMDWPRGGTLAQRTVAEQLPPSEDFYNALSSESGLIPMIGVIGAAQDALTILARTAIVVVLSMYWSADRRRFEQLSLALLPGEHHERVREAWEAMDSGVGAYVRGEILQSLIAGLALGLVFRFFGVPYAALLAVWIAAVRAIPWFGTILAILPFLLATIAGAPVPGVTTAIVTLVVLLTLRLIIGMRFFTPRRYNGLWMVIVIVALGELWGVGGALIAPVIAVAVQLLVERLVPETAGKRLPTVTDRVESLRARLAGLTSGLSENDSEIPFETKTEIDRLEQRVRSLFAETVESA